MPTSNAPINLHQPDETSPESSQSTGDSSPTTAQEPETATSRNSTSRWVDYDTHELLQMISDLEDERRWARLREGVLWAVLLHALVILVLALLPKYLFVPRVVEPKLGTQHDQWTYLDSPRLPTRAPAPKPTLAPPKPPVIDKKTLDALNKETAPPPLPQTQQPSVVQAPVQPKPTAPIPPSPQSQSQLETPRPSAVPARPNFAMGSQNPADQLRDAMRGSRNNSPGGGQLPSMGGLARHPGAGGGVQILSDTQGVDFSNWIQRWHWETERTWDPLIPDEVNPPIMKQGVVVVRFKVLPNGRLMDGGMVLEGRSGDTALDRAAWGALTGSNYPPLPRDFHGPYLELRASFWYNMQPR